VQGSDTDLVGDESNGFGGISNELMLTSNISTTLLIVGLPLGNVWIHHKPTMVILFAISSSLFSHTYSMS